MDQPVLKYTYADGRKASEFELRNGAEVRYVQQPDGIAGWYNRTGVMVASNAPEARQESGSNLPKHQPGDQGRQAAKASGGNRSSKSRKKPEAQAES